MQNQENNMIYRKCSHNKFTKSQWKNLRSNKYFLFERSYKECKDRIMFMGAIINTYYKDKDKIKYRINSIKKLIIKIEDAFLTELKAIGYLNDDANVYDLNNKDIKHIKISIEKQ